MKAKQSFSRREFLKRSMAACGAAWLAPTIASASALGIGPKDSPSDRILVGMIGMGRQAYQVNMKQFLRMPEVQIVAVCDVDSWRLNNAKKAIEAHYGKTRDSGLYKGCAAFVDYKELLARKDIDAVMISSPDHWHAPMTVDAFQAGKDVSLEKPITRTIAEGRELSALAKKLGRVFRVDSELRSTKGVHRAAELIRNGRIGKIQRITVGVPGTDQACPPQPEMPVPAGLDYERWQGPAPRAPYTEKRVHPPKSYGRPGWMRHLYYCDGMVTNWGTHMNDAAMWCADLETTGPVEVEGTGTYPPAESFWNVLLKFEVRYRFANGVQWTYRTETPYFKIEGEKGWIRGTFGDVRAEPASLLESKIGNDEIRFPLKSDKQDFIDSVRSRSETLEPAEVGHRVTSLCLLGQIAIQIGVKLRWDPEKEIFLGNDEANELVGKRILGPR